MNKARYIMIGGFLGAGKTTSIQRFAQYLDARGQRVGLITNDQGSGLVDSAIGRSNRFPVEEISGGCFCCRFNSLVDAARHLSSENRPDVFLAEPVGSCTDLVATVNLPLSRIYGEDFTVAPLSVVVDPVRAARVLGLDEGRRFSQNVRYIYLKQLEEAEVIVINKIDLVDEGERDRLRAAIGREYPKAELREISARNGVHLEGWFESILEREMNVSALMDVDYERYGQGEALLGWLNGTLRVSAPGEEGEFDGNALVTDLACALREAMESEGVEVAHLKMTLNPLGEPYEVAAVNVVRTDQEPELSHRLVDPVEQGELLLNMRCEADPETLHRALRTALAEIIEKKHALSFVETHLEHFRPGKPEPTHRLTEA